MGTCHLLHRNSFASHKALIVWGNLFNKERKGNSLNQHKNTHFHASTLFTANESV